jgi:D-xylulose reductase
VVSQGKVDVKKLITGIVRFKEAEQAFKSVKSGKGIKVVIAGPNEN